MEIKVNGHSGCTIEVMNRGNRLCLVKSTSDVKYINRLIEQAEKQKKYAGHRYKAVKIPEILSIVQTPGQCHVEMEYIYSKNFVDFLETSNVHQIDTFISSVCFSFLFLSLPQRCFLFSFSALLPTLSQRKGSERTRRQKSQYRLSKVCLSSSNRQQ